MKKFLIGFIVICFCFVAFAKHETPSRTCRGSDATESRAPDERFVMNGPRPRPALGYTPG